tara:strand:+ start:770 stop:1474 length:705 start_codon:yes stop_codon:yes gene_type:complete
MPNAIFYKYPKTTEVNRILPKSKLYEQGKVNSTIRELFVTQVEQITWANKLSAQTLNIEAHEQIKEIQIFSIVLKGDELSDDVLQTIDRAILHPIIFEVISHSQNMRTTACFKEVGINGGVTLSEYYSSRWQKRLSISDSQEPDNIDKRQSLPLTLNIKALYEQLLASLLLYPLKEHETFPELIKRIDAIKLLNKQQQQITKKLSNEKQFKNKVKINAELKQIKQALKLLTLSV